MKALSISLHTSEAKETGKSAAVIAEEVGVSRHTAELWIKKYRARSLGYMPAAVQAHIINRIIYPPEGTKAPLKEIVLEARDTAAKLFAGDEHLLVLIDIIDRAVMLAEGDLEDDLDNIHQLGQGGVAEETLAIALYCALRYQDDFSAGMIAAVNHSGDSDSTGAVAGNILGAWVGYQAIEEKWKQDLELSDVILEIADDLCYGCQMSEYGTYRDPKWEMKYIWAHRPDTCKPVLTGEDNQNVDKEHEICHLR